METSNLVLLLLMLLCFYAATTRLRDAYGLFSYYNSSQEIIFCCTPESCGYPVISKCRLKSIYISLFIKLYYFFLLLCNIS